MKKIVKNTLIAVSVLGTLALPLSGSAIAADPVAVAQTTGKTFVKKKKKIKGEWNIVKSDGKTFIHFNDAFKTKNGPDLKVFLSPQTITDVTGKTAIDGAVLLGILRSHKGAQKYEVPADVNLSDFKSVLVHCEAYSILWGGSDL